MMNLLKKEDVVKKEVSQLSKLISRIGKKIAQHIKALTAFKHVLEIEPDHIKALKMIKQALSNSLKTLLI